MEFFLGRFLRKCRCMLEWRFGVGQIRVAVPRVCPMYGDGLVKRPVMVQVCACCCDLAGAARLYGPRRVDRRNLETLRLLQPV